LVATTSLAVLQLCLKREISERFGLLCCYLLEMAYIQGTVHRYRPSALAFAAINLANSVLKTEHTDTERVREVFAVTTEEMLGCFK